MYAPIRMIPAPGMNSSTVTKVCMSEFPASTRTSPGCSKNVPLKASLMKWPVVVDAHEATAIKIKAPATIAMMIVCQFIFFLFSIAVFQYCLEVRTIQLLLFIDYFHWGHLCD